MERKSFKFAVKSVDEAQGTFEGIASAFRSTPDKQKDIARPGAFKKTISENPEVPSFYMHDVMAPVGKVSMTETTEGLSVKGQLVRGIQRAEESLLLMKAGVIKTLSIGYDVLQRELKDGIRYLTEVKVYEVSLVVGDFACDDQAVITSVKFNKAGRVMSSKDLAKYKEALKLLNELLEYAEPSDEKAMTFDETYGQTMRNIAGREMLDSLFMTIDNVMYDPAETDKAASINTAISAFQSAFVDWIGQAVASGLIKTDKAQFETKAQAIKDNFQALLKSEEPGKTTPEDLEAAYLGDVLNGIKAEVGGFDASEADRRINELLAKLK